MVGIALALSLICPASVDTLYKVDFGAPMVNDWVPGPQWVWMEDCINASLHASSSGTWAHYDSDSLRSPIITLPQGIDSVVLVFDHWYHAQSRLNWLSWAETTMSLQMTAPGIQGPAEIWNVYYYEECPADYAVEDSGLVSIPLPMAWPGEALSFRFNGRVGAWTDELYASSRLIWDIRAFYILNYTGDRSLEPSTWGSIKALF